MNLTTDPIPTAEELFNPPPPETGYTPEQLLGQRMAASITELENNLDVAEKLRAAAALKVLEAEDTDGQDTPGSKEAQQALQAISSQMEQDRRKLDGLYDARTEYWTRYTENEELQKLKDIEQAWDATARLAKQRIDAARTIRDLVKELHERTEDLIDLSEQMHDAAPTDKRKNIGFSDLSPASITEAVRIQLRKAGFLWAYSLPFGKDSQPSLVQKITVSNRACLSHRKDSEAKTA